MKFKWKSKKKSRIEMWDKKYMYGDKFTFGLSQNGQNMLKKGQQEKYFFVH